MKKMLVVDDEIEICEFLKLFFQERDFDVRTAYSGEEALKITEKMKPDIILLDIHMPGMDGIATLKAVKQKHPDIKVIMVTVASDKETRQKAAELGADDFIKKPLNTAYLEGTVSLKVAVLAKERKK